MCTSTSTVWAQSFPRVPGVELWDASVAGAVCRDLSSMKVARGLSSSSGGRLINCGHLWRCAADPALCSVLRAETTPGSSRNLPSETPSLVVVAAEWENNKGAGFTALWFALAVCIREAFWYASASVSSWRRVAAEVASAGKASVSRFFGRGDGVSFVGFIRTDVTETGGDGEWELNNLKL